MANLLQHETRDQQSVKVGMTDALSTEAGEVPVGSRQAGELSLDKNLRNILRINKRYWAVVLAALAGGPVFTYLMDLWLGSAPWWGQWQGVWLQNGFSFAWLLAILILALKSRFLAGELNARPLFQSMQKIAETDPLALEGTVPVIRQIANSWDVRKEHRKAALETLERIEAARKAIGNLPVEASAPVMGVEELPLAAASNELSGADADPK
jgi:hypothetical protein